jgi:hypothetical protein
VDRRVPPARREVLPGVFLVVSAMGSYSVHRQDSLLGYIHASATPLWNAYVRRVGQDDLHLGRMKQDEAVRAIVTAWDSALAGLNRRP